MRDRDGQEHQTTRKVGCGRAGWQARPGEKFGQAGCAPSGSPAGGAFRDPLHAVAPGDDELVPGAPTGGSAVDVSVVSATYER
ncbi:hypothetical protein GCM10009751_28620 [Myceligenerans crystallogenes]|uniref:Uncharacterized protein n=1 Tax=Myceligenerans crystallogenes TaxID=316335 RepID=A0ABN2NHL1_9MICO